MDGSIINSGCNNTRYLEKDHLPPRCFSFVVFSTQICNKYAEKEYSLTISFFLICGKCIFQDTYPRYYEATI